MWFHPGGIANIICLSKVAEKYRMSYKSTDEKKYLVFLPRVEVRSFRQCDRGLFYSNMAAGQYIVLLNTADHNKSKYSERNYATDLMTCKLQY